MKIEWSGIRSALGSICFRLPQTRRNSVRILDRLPSCQRTSGCRRRLGKVSGCNLVDAVQEVQLFFVYRLTIRTVHDRHLVVVLGAIVLRDRVVWHRGFFDSVPVRFPELGEPCQHELDRRVDPFLLLESLALGHQIVHCFALSTQFLQVSTAKFERLKKE